MLPFTAVAVLEDNRAVLRGVVIDVEFKSVDVVARARIAKNGLDVIPRNHFDVGKNRELACQIGQCGTDRDIPRGADGGVCKTRVIADFGVRAETVVGVSAL